jgi:hypothetical protein
MPVVTENLDLLERRHGDVIPGPLLSDREECLRDSGEPCVCGSFERCPEFDDVR